MLTLKNKLMCRCVTQHQQNCLHLGTTKNLQHTNKHPYCETNPSLSIQLHHEVDVNKDTDQRQHRKQRHLEQGRRKSFITHANTCLCNKNRRINSKSHPKGEHCLNLTHSEVQYLRSSMKSIYLKGDILVALGLSPDDDEANQGENSQADHHSDPYSVSLYDLATPHC